MKVLIDTNVLIDFILMREPYASNAEKILLQCKNQTITGCVAAHFIMNIFYILRKEYTQQERRLILLNIRQILTVVGITKDNIENFLKNEEFTDMEDCLQMECTINFDVEYIITRNIKDFKESCIPAIEPQEFLKIC